MKRDVIINIKGIQRAEGQEETVELYTMGNLCKKKDGYYLCYDETQATGFEGSHTTLLLDTDSRVTMRRSDPFRSQIIVEMGRRHQCHYETGYGEMFIGVLGNHVSSTLTEEGGNLQFKYSLDINTSLAMENEVYIDVRAV